MELSMSFARTKTSGLARYVATMLCLTGGFTPSVKAQVALDQFKPAPLASDGFALSRPDVLGNLEWGALAMLDYANSPLVYEKDPVGEIKVVEHHLVLHVGAAIGIGSRLTVFGMLPIHVVMNGDEPQGTAPDADGAGIGDVAFGGRLLMLGNANKVVQMSAEFTARLPTAELANDSQTYSGDKIGSYEPALVAEVHLGRLGVRVRPGARLRQNQQIGDLKLGSELVYGLGARLRLVDQLYAHAELYGSTVFANFGDRERTPLELLLGGKYSAADWFFGAAGGPGFIAGYGAPTVRVVATIGYAPVVPLDRDGDGLMDADDRCPLDPEDRDAFEDANGCPDPDNDQDAVLDVQDECPLEPEDKDVFEDADGCPDPDNDRDGLLDPADECPNDPEDKDAFEDANGCPDPDNDHDGILDGEDKCPITPGVVEAQGCPPARVEVETKIMSLDSVEFETNDDVILGKSEPILEEVQKTLAANLQLKKVRLEGHTDDVGQTAKNLDLSRRRARSVVRWLVAHGLEASRFEAYGCGESRPLKPGTTPEARKTNRRVELHIVDPAPPETRSTEGCKVIPVD